MNILKIGVTKKEYAGLLKNEDILCTLTFDTDITEEKLNSLISNSSVPKIYEKIGKMTNDETAYIYMDLNENKLGGCAIGGATYNATRVSVMIMLVHQLTRQLLTELRGKQSIKKIKGLKML